MKRLLITLSFCLVFFLTGFAQQNDDTPATKEDIQRYMEVMHSHELMQQMAESMSKQMREMLHQQFLKDKDKLPPDFEDRMNKLMGDMFRDMPWDEMMQAMIPAYQKHLTRGDVDRLIAFYSSPTGQKLLREMPAMMADAMQSMMPIVQNYMEKVQQRVQVETAHLMKESQKK
jgi:uncharacterized protein